LGCFENYLFFLPVSFVFIRLSLRHSRTTEFWKSSTLLFISKEWYIPLFFLLTPLRIVNNMFNLFLSHYHVQNGTKFFHLFLLLSDCIQQLFFLILMLILNVLEFLKIGHILPFDLFESSFHLIDFFIQRFIVFLNTQ